MPVAAAAAAGPTDHRAVVVAGVLSVVRLLQQQQQQGRGQQHRAASQDEREPVDDVEHEEEYREGDEEELVYPPVFLRQLLYADGVGGRSLLHLVLEVVLADDLDAEAVLGGNVALLLEQNGRVPERRKRKEKLKKI